jgi:predicted nucleic acid-binding protein
MERLAAILGRTVYLDTNILIYAVEGYEPEAAFLHGLLAALEEGRFVRSPAS